MGPAASTGFEAEAAHFASADPEARFRDLWARFGPAVARLCRANEADPQLQRDLEQEICVALWRALPRFEGRASLRTWVFRIAHNVAASHVAKSRRDRGRTLAPLSALEDVPFDSEPEASVDRAALIERVAMFVRSLRPIDRQVIVLYLEGLDQGEIAEVTGLSATHVSTKVHRIRMTLTQRFAAAAKTGGA